MRKILILFLLSIGVCFAGKPYATLHQTYTKTLGGSASDTTTLNSITIDGDSVGVQVEYNQDSIKGYLRYQYVSYNGYTNGTAIASLSDFLTSGYNEKGWFTYKFPMLGGTNKVRVHLITKNGKVTSQTIVINIYKILWK